MITITLISHANIGDRHSTVVKPQTVVDGDCSGIRMREADEVVHLRDEDKADPICSICGKRATIWLSSRDRHEVHTARCS